MSGIRDHGELAAETRRVRRVQDKGAPSYDRRISFFERVLFDDGREWVCGRASGEVLEIAVGTGRNLSLYGDDVRLTGIELSPEMLAIALRRRQAAGREADLQLGDAQALDFATSSFDSVVCTLALCTIPDDRLAIREVHRVLRPGGRFLLLEHVRSPVAAVRAVQRLLDPLFVRFEADHLTREPLEHLIESRFEVETLERSKWGIVERAVARKPG